MNEKKDVQFFEGNFWVFVNSTMKSLLAYIGSLNWTCIKDNKDMKF